MKELVIFGNGELAELAFFYFNHDSEWVPKAFCVDGEYLKSSSFNGLPVVPMNELSAKYPPSAYSAFVAIGYKEMNALRKRKYLEMKDAGYAFASYVSGKTTKWPDLQIGENCMIMENNTIMPFCSIGNNVLVWVNSILSHHSRIDDHVCITSHCAIGGNVHIEEQAFLGLNCTIRNGLHISKGALIGAQANLTRDAKENGVYLGNPAQLVSEDAGSYML